MIHKQYTLYSVDPQKGTVCQKKYCITDTPVQHGLNFIKEIDLNERT